MTEPIALLRSLADRAWKRVRSGEPDHDAEGWTAAVGPVARGDEPTGRHFHKALAFAAELHRDQVRKGTRVPYVSHLLAVAALVMEDGGDEDQIVAALLHDVVEDSGVPLDVIRREFGDRVAEIVMGCTDAETRPKPPWRERKEAYIAALAEAPPEVRRVSAADKVHNARAILRDYLVGGESVWERFNGGRDGTLWYYRALVDAFRAAGGGPLVEELDIAVSELERRAGAMPAPQREAEPTARGAGAATTAGGRVAGAAIAAPGPSRPALDRRQVHGIDFSGAADAGRRIWIASGTPSEGRVRIEALFRARDLDAGAMDRERALAALRAFIAGRPADAFGLDFPFGLPQGLVDDIDWANFSRGFGERYRAPEELREGARQLHDRELRRATDLATNTPFAPTNLRMYKQTYYGIRDVLAPLVAAGQAAVLPMQEPLPDRAWLLEVCPAATLKVESRSVSYKGADRQLRKVRAEILAQVEAAGLVEVADPQARRLVRDDSGGDALDAVLAAAAAWRAIATGTARAPGGMTDAHRLEGWVFV